MNFLLYSAFLAVLVLKSLALPAPFFWYEDYSDDSLSSSSEDHEQLKKILIYLNVTGFPNYALIPNPNINVGTGVVSGSDTSGLTTDSPPLVIPITLDLSAGNPPT